MRATIDGGQFFGEVDVWMELEELVEEGDAAVDELAVEGVGGEVRVHDVDFVVDAADEAGQRVWVGGEGEGTVVGDCMRVRA